MLRRLAFLTIAAAFGAAAFAQAAPTIQSYPKPGVKDITTGPDGNPWTTVPGTNKVARVVSGDPPTIDGMPPNDCCVPWRPIPRVPA